LLRLAVRVDRRDAELVLAELLELAPSGVEEVDIDSVTVEYAVYGSAGELPELPDLRAAAGSALVDISTRELADDWAERWREFHRPLVLGRRLRVRPPWEAADPAVALDVVIEPGRAFGTGAHPTTRLCLEMLLDLSPPVPDEGWRPAQRVIDLGCGSGVLAIVAARLGLVPVLALDFDPVAVEATVANARENGVAELVCARRFDLREEELPGASVVLANLLAPILRDLAVRMREGVPPARMIASGLLSSEAAAVASELACAGLRLLERRDQGGWAALLLGASG
jgi:ribosomal protein L11 methyltransferase